MLSQTLSTRDPTVNGWRLFHKPPWHGALTIEGPKESLPSIYCRKAPIKPVGKYLVKIQAQTTTPYHRKDRFPYEQPEKKRISQLTGLKKITGNKTNHQH